MDKFSNDTSRQYCDEVEKFFPGKRGNWCVSSFLLPDELPIQGWKIHISATSVNALDILICVGILVLKHSWPSKVIASLELLRKMNSGLFFGYSQIGKFMTIYCVDYADFLSKLSILKKVTGSFQGPTIPSDIKIQGSSCLYYRYGNFRDNKLGKNIITDPRGNILLDGRCRRSAIPSWVKDTMDEQTVQSDTSPISLLEHGYLVYDCLSQRGKGGVFKALSLFTQPIESVIIKEGRKHGEEESIGRDGYARLLNEFRMLTFLKNTSVKSPKIIDKIETENRLLLITTQISGVGLNELISYLAKRKHSLAIGQLIRIAGLLLMQVSTLHSYELCHRDLKPANLIMNLSGELSIIDFEGAFIGSGNLKDPWGSMGFAPPEWEVVQDLKLRMAGDIYSVGATLFHLFTGSIYGDSNCSRENNYKMNLLPESLRNLLEKMLHHEPNQRPTAYIAMKHIEQIMPEVQPTRFLLNTINRIQRKNEKQIGTTKFSMAVKNNTDYNHIIRIYDRFQNGRHEVFGSPFILSAGQLSISFEICSNKNDHSGSISIYSEGELPLEDIYVKENMVYLIA